MNRFTKLEVTESHPQNESSTAPANYIIHELDDFRDMNRLRDPSATLHDYYANKPSLNGDIAKAFLFQNLI